MFIISYSFPGLGIQKWLCWVVQAQSLLWGQSALRFPSSQWWLQGGLRSSLAVDMWSQFLISWRLPSAACVSSQHGRHLPWEQVSQDGWVDGWMDRWVDGWMGGWVDGWMDESRDCPTSLLWRWIYEMNRWRSRFLTWRSKKVVSLHCLFWSQKMPM